MTSEVQLRDGSGNLISSTNPLPVAGIQSTGTRTDRSSTITAGGSAQTLMAARAARNGYYVQNQSTGNLWINDKGSAATADQNSLLIAPGLTYESAPNDRPVAAISIIGATTGQAFNAGEF